MDLVLEEVADRFRMSTVYLWGDAPRLAAKPG